MELWQPGKPVSAYCAIGSNQGDREQMLYQAAFLLAASERTDLVRASRIYETPPWGRSDQPAFLNAVVELRTSLLPPELLGRLQAIERHLGREPGGERWGPRPIDLDITLYGETVIDAPRLVVPHPRLAGRAFALVPLVEIAPDLADPRTGEPYASALDRLGPEAREACRDIGPLLAQIDAPGHAGLFVSASVYETERLAEGLGQRAEGGEVVAMVAELGAGKTCFARGFARGLGIQAPITSPSYVLIKSYDGPRLALHHADFYRLGDAAPGRADEGAEGVDPGQIGLDDHLDDPDSVVLIEWADRLPDWLTPPFHLVEITVRDDESRLVLVRDIQ